MASPSRVARSREGWETITKVVDYAHAVGRIGTRGSGVLLSLPGPANTVSNGSTEHFGIVLTTSIVAGAPSDLKGETITFFETPVAGTGAKWSDVAPVSVALRPDKVFYCSAKEPTAASLSLRKRLALQRLREQLEDEAAAAAANSSTKNGQRVRVNSTAGLTAEQAADLEDAIAAEDSSVLLAMTSANNTTTNGSAAAAATNAAAAAAALAAENDDDEDIREIGYTIVACEIRDAGNATRDITRVRPLGLPLIISTIPPTRAGDTHLLITHENSKARRYLVASVVNVGDHHCEYEHDDPHCYFSSGGPVFSSGGDFIGLQHQSGTASYCIFIRDVVQSLFDSAMLGLCRIPVLDSNDEEDPDEATANAALALAGGPNAAHNAAGSIMQPMRLMDVGCGDQIVDFEELERRRAKKMQRAGGGANASAATPETLLIRRHLDVWKEWRSDYKSLVMLLHAFPYQAKLARLALQELTSHENRLHIDSVARLGGIGIMFEILDGHPFDEELVLTAVTALARISLFDANRDAIARSDGVAVILSVMSEHAHSYAVQQWATYILLNLTAAAVDPSLVAAGGGGGASTVASQRADENVAALVECRGVEVAIANAKHHPDGRYLQRWVAQLLGNVVISAGGRFLELAMTLGVLPLLNDRLRQFADDSFVLVGLSFLLMCITRQQANGGTSAAAAAASPASSSSPINPLSALGAVVQAANGGKVTAATSSGAGGSSAPASFLVQDDGVRRVMALLKHHTAKTPDPILIGQLLASAANLLDACRDQIPLVAEEMEALAVAATQAHMTEPKLHTTAARLLRLLGVSDPYAKYSHFQVDHTANVR